MEIVLFNLEKNQFTPEALALETYIKLCGPKGKIQEIVAHQSSFQNPFEYIFASKKARDDIHGEYPIILYKHHYIQKDKIIEFLKLKFNVNINLTHSSKC